MIPAAVRGTLSGGAHFAGRYRIVRALAAGGMGAVYEVFDEATRSPRALKVMLPSVVESPEHRMRFEREAQLTGSIESEHLVRITDAGIDGDVPFIVMELLRGEDLRSVLRQRGRLPPELVVPYLRQVALGLEKTHAAGIIHRDLKPANLFLAQRDDGSPCMKVLDFGIAKLTTASSAIETGTVGTPLYMAPEQARGDRGVTHLADLLALAHVAYALLVGEAYFQEELEQSDSIVGVFIAVADGPREAPCARAWRRKSVRLPPAFDAWFLQAAAASPEGRFQNARAEIEALANALAGSSAAAQVKTAAMVASAFEPPRGAQQPAHPPAHAQASASHASQSHHSQYAAHVHSGRASASHGGAWSQASGHSQRMPQAAVATNAKLPPAVLWGAGALAFGALAALVAFIVWSRIEAAGASTSDEEASQDGDERPRSAKKPDAKSTKDASGSRCYPGFADCRLLDVPSDRRVDPMSLLPDAEALARTALSESPRLSQVFCERARAGRAELRVGGGGAVIFHFESEDDLVAVHLLPQSHGLPDQLAVSSPHPKNAFNGTELAPLGVKHCSFDKLWEEIRRAGVPDDEYVSLTHQSMMGNWVVSRKRETAILLSSTTCLRQE